MHTHMLTLDAMQTQVQNEKPLGELLDGNTKEEKKAKAEALETSNAKEERKAKAEASRKARKQPK